MHESLTVSHLQYHQGLPSVVPAAPVTRASKAPAVEEVDTTHDRYRVGDQVLVTDAFKVYVEFVNCPDVIKSIVQGHNYFFCVLLDCPNQRKDVQDLNSQRVNKVRFPFLKTDEGELRCLKVGHIVSFASARQMELNLI